MDGPIEISTKFVVEPVYMAGCGHLVFITANQLRDRRKDGHPFFCAHCGRANHFEAPVAPKPKKTLAKVFQLIRGKKP